MKKIQELCTALVLVFVLTGSAVAGHIGTDAVPPPPPPPDASAIIAQPDDTPTDGTVSPIAESESLVIEITLGLLQLLSLF
jgi:hypothetical protein